MKRRNFLTPAAAASVAAVTGLPRLSAGVSPSVTEVDLSAQIMRQRVLSLHPMAVLEGVVANRQVTLAGQICIRHEKLVTYVGAKGTKACGGFIASDWYCGDLRYIHPSIMPIVLARPSGLPEWLINREFDDDTIVSVGREVIPITEVGSPIIRWVLGDEYIAMKFNRPEGAVLVTTSRNVGVLDRALFPGDSKMHGADGHHIHITGDVIADSMDLLLKDRWTKIEIDQSQLATKHNRKGIFT